MTLKSLTFVPIFKSSLCSTLPIIFNWGEATFEHIKSVTTNAGMKFGNFGIITRWLNANQ